MRVLTVVGARPQFVKAAVVSRVIAEHNSRGTGPAVEEILVHTGQHYDENMSKVFFEELDIPEAQYDLGVKSSLHGDMTGQMLARIEATLLEHRPDWVLVYGDTNSTLAGGLAAAKLNIRVAHVEAGLRSFNRRMPEEINRVLVDHLSTSLFCPTDTAVENLRSEGIEKGVSNVGDVMLDASLYYRAKAQAHSTITGDLGMADQPYVLATCHRAENTDDPVRLEGIFRALHELAARMPVLLPLHPRTRKCLDTHGLMALLEGMCAIEPVSFLDMIALEAGAHAIVTDSGGVQKEAFFFRVPCVTVRDETEWVETVETGWNRLAGADTRAIVQAVSDASRPSEWPSLYGTGDTGERILGILAEQA
jgi:UDP-GlcNAc3NAcA epimerase